MCLYPRIVKNPKYEPNKKNKGVVPPIKDSRVMGVPIGCGKCIECSKQKKREWQVRLLEDVRHNKNGVFVTLTFSNKSIKELTEAIAEQQTKKDEEQLKGYELDNAIATIAVRRFVERWRKEFKKSVRHWLVTELGHNGTENIHLHGIIWTNKGISKIKKHWKYGYIYPNTKEERQINWVNEITVNYITKYIAKQDQKHKEYKPKILTSAGIGRGYLEREDAELNVFNGTETKETYTTKTGHEIAMPIYWRNHIYTEEEREKLWLQKLDKQEMWIMGERVDISEGTEELQELINYYRLKNERLGYGNNEGKWDRKKYEEERRILLHQKRMEDAEKADTQNGLSPSADLRYAASTEEWDD